MKKGITYQKMKKGHKNVLSMAQCYYNILSVFNEIGLTEREVQLIAFIAVRGNIMGKELKHEFCKKYSTTTPTINNMVSRLKKKEMLIKKDGRIVVEPAIALNFKNNILLEIRIAHEKA